MAGRVWVVFALFAASVGSASAQSSSSAPHTGGFSPFRGNNVMGAEFDAVAIEQEDCPLAVVVASTGRDDRGVQITVKVTNTGDGPASRHTLSIWAFGPDGTMRGSQQQKQSKALAAGESRHVDVTLRTLQIKPGDRLVVAVQEVVGDDPWRKDGKALEADVRRALFP